MAAFVALIALAVVFTFLNGVHDSSNIVATLVASRSMSIRRALWLTAAAEFIGPFLAGTAVARAIGGDVLPTGQITLVVVYAALASAILWNILTWIFGLPSSSTHALVGGLVGAGVVQMGVEAVQWAGVLRVATALVLSPLLGLAAGFLLTRLIFFLLRSASNRVNRTFQYGQIATGLGLALSHSGNDAQKSMGMIVLGLIALGRLDGFSVPLWVVAVSAGAMALGTAIGGRALIKTMGQRFYKIRPVDGFSTQAASAGVIFGAAVLGAPVSTTQVVSSAIMGVGAADRMKKVRWGVGRSILLAWVLTVPAAALLAAGLSLLFRLLGA